jgi:hypothetical protein
MTRSPSKTTTPKRDAAVQKRDRHLQLRLTDEERLAFGREAQRLGVTMSQWLRGLARAAAGLNERKSAK